METLYVTGKIINVKWMLVLKTIADTFAKQPKELFNSNPSNTQDLRAMMDNLCTFILTYSKCVTAVTAVTLEYMKEAINRLNCEKQDGLNNSMVLEHVINATDYFYEYLCVSFSKYLPLPLFIVLR